MNQLQLIDFVIGKLIYVRASVKTAGCAVGNRESLEAAAEDIAAILDDAGEKLDQCCRILSRIPEKNPAAGRTAR